MDNDTDSATTDPGGHLFRTVSAHHTSQGRICYQKCACGSWRIERYPVTGRVQLEAVRRPIGGAERPDARQQPLRRRARLPLNAKSRGSALQDPDRPGMMALSTEEEIPWRTDDTA